MSDARAQLAALTGLPVDSAELDVALTHPSFANENSGTPDNQRLEFLGDAVLGLCSAELLYRRLPDADEGTLTRLRARVVNAEALAGWAREHGVPDALRVGRGGQAGGVRQGTKVLADAVEALVAAVYLTQGLDAASAFARRIVEPEFDRDEGLDPKSALQERAQSLNLGAPTYRVAASGGASHEPWFEVEVCLGHRVLASARGRSKRVAERAAATLALAIDEADLRVGA